jgi:hypothetical protein
MERYRINDTGKDREYKGILSYQINISGKERKEETVWGRFMSREG